MNLYALVASTAILSNVVVVVVNLLFWLLPMFVEFFCVWSLFCYAVFVCNHLAVEKIAGCLTVIALVWW